MLSLQCVTRSTAIAVASPPPMHSAATPRFRFCASSACSSVTISRALAKTITYRTIATVVDFTTNYVVVRNITEATILSASGFILGPFVYFGHEKAWDYFTSRAERAIDLLPPSETRLLPAPA